MYETVFVNKLDWLLLGIKICRVYHFAAKQTGHAMSQQWAVLVR